MRCATRGALALALLVALASGMPAGAEAPVGGAERWVGVRPWVARRLERARQALAADRPDDARDVVAALARQERRLSTPERALLLEITGYVHAASARWAEAAAAFERALETGGLSATATRDLRFDLAQLYVALDRAPDAVRLFESWLAETPHPDAEARYRIATAYLHAGRAAEAVRYARAAVRDRSDPPDAWLRLLLAALLRTSRHDEAIPVAERLVARAPRTAAAWQQLAAVYAAAGRPRDALAALEVAYAGGLLQREEDLLALVRLQLATGVPRRAAAVLEAAVRDGTVGRTPATLGVLATAWLAARDRPRARAALADAAAVADTGEFDLRLATLEAERGRWDAARRALDAAFAKGGLGGAGGAWLLRGILDLRAGRRAAARRAFDRARADPATATEASRWIEHLAGGDGAAAGDATPAAAAAPDALARPAPAPHTGEARRPAGHR